MKFLLDFFPVLLFFLAYKQYGSLSVEFVQLVNQLPIVELTPKDEKDSLTFAALVLIIATLLQNIIHWALYRRFEKMHLISLVALVMLGSMTIATNDPAFLKWKVTLLNWIFAIILFGSLYVGKKSLMELMMSNAIKVSDFTWRQATLYSTLFFAAVGIINLVFAFYIPGENDINWVSFKSFGILSLTVVFLIALVVYLKKHAIHTIEDNHTENP